jgi:hypothetical protein
MGQIYSNASQVLMYLGHGSEATDRVMDLLNSQQASALWSSFVRRKFDISEFLRLRYFDRVWVLQEIALAKLTTLVLGNKVARWSASSVRDLQTHALTGDIPLPSALQWHPSSELERDFLKVLQKSRNCSASDQKDKVYAVLGLVQPDVIKNLVVDYSLSLEDVYLNVAEHLIMEHNCLNLLKHVARDPAQQRVGRLPTWVPEWHNRISYSPMLTQFDAQKLTELSDSWYWSQMLQHAEHIRFIEGMSNHDILNHQLSLESPRSTASWFKRISEALPQPHAIQHDLSLYISHRFRRDFRHHILKCDEPYVPTSTNVCLVPPRRILSVRAHALDRIPPTYTNGRRRDLVALYADPAFPLESVPMALGSALRCTDCSSDGDCRTPKPCTSCAAKNLSREDRPTSQQNWVPSLMYEDLRAFKAKSLFETVHSVGASPCKWMKKDDTIWAIDGADVPFILRRIEDHYVLVGACYLHRATKSFPCGCCGRDAKPWPMETQIIDIW